MFRKSLLILVVSGSLFVSIFVFAGEPIFTFYDIAGKNAKALRMQMNEKRPYDSNGKRFDAVTRSRFSYNYMYFPTSDGCKFTEFTAKLETTIIMPRWVGIDPTSSIGKKWQTYYQALHNHELGHYDIALSALKELEESGSKFETSNKCDSINKEFELVFASILQKSKLQHQKYDFETDHGKRLGATFP